MNAGRALRLLSALDRHRLPGDLDVCFCPAQRDELGGQRITEASEAVWPRERR